VAKTRTASRSAGQALPPVALIGFGKRLGAALIDGFLVAIFTGIVIMVVALIGAIIGMFHPNGSSPFGPLLFGLLLVLSVLYYVIAWARTGQTVGMSLIGLKVIAKDGSQVGFGKAILRYIGYIVSGLVLSIGFLWIVFDGKRQGWHDKIAGTYVIREEDSYLVPKGASLVPETKGTAWAWVLVWLAFLILLPGALLGSLFVLGPTADKVLMGLLAR
jgi:uncharacterized RDD family membrane protein YckC